MKSSYLSLIALLCLTGCGTVRNLTGEGEIRVFGGVISDVEELSRDGNIVSPAHELLIGVEIVDLPLSLVADAATLPITIPCEFVRTQRRDAPSKPAAPFGRALAGLESYNLEVREAAIQVVSACPQRAAESLPSLIEIIHREEDPRGSAQEALSALQRHHPDPARLYAAELAHWSKHQVPFLELLAELGPRAAPAIPALLPLLDEGENLLRLKTCQAFGAMRGAGAPAAERLARVVFEDENDEVARFARAALVAMGPAAREAGPRVVRGLRGERREMALRILGALADPRSVRGLVAELEGKNGVRKPYELGDVMECFRAMGTVAAPAARAVVPLLRSPDRNLRSDATKALVAMGPEAGLAVARSLGELHGEARVAALVVLDEVPTPEAWPALLALHERGDPVERDPALRALSVTGRPEVEAVLLKALSQRRSELLATELALRAKLKSPALFAAHLAVLQRRGLESHVLLDALVPYCPEQAAARRCFLPFLAAPSPELRALAERALIGAGPQVIPELEKAEKELRWEASASIRRVIRILRARSELSGAGAD